MDRLLYCFIDITSIEFLSSLRLDFLYVICVFHYCACLNLHYSSI